MLRRIQLDHFTAFKRLEFVASSGLNVLVGANSTGKTHLLKVAYSACDVTMSREGFGEKLLRVFMPYHGSLGRLAHRQRGRIMASLEVESRRSRIKFEFSSHVTDPSSARVTGATNWTKVPMKCAYIPVKEMLANAPGFRSLYSSREIHFEEIYRDIIDRAYLPLLRGPIPADRARLLQIIAGEINGRVEVEDEEFFLRGQQGKLEFSLVAEGIRKLALLWLLIQNGTLLDGAVLFWDEPEANLNPRMIRPVVRVILELQRLGVQIFIATHDYVVLKEIELQKTAKDAVIYHAFARDTKRGVVVLSTEDYLEIDPNAIADTFANLYDREIANAMSMKGK